MNLKTNDWEIYAILREYDGKKKAEEYKQRCFKRYKKYGLLSQNENNGYNFVKAFGNYDSYTLKCFIPAFFSDTEKENLKIFWCVYAFLKLKNFWCENCRAKSDLSI